MLNVGVIGLGVGAKHAQAYTDHPGCRVIALCDLSDERLAEVAKEHPMAATTRDATAILDNPDIHIVSVASYDDAHHGQVVRALEQGKHVFVEKPVCLHPAELKSIRRALAARPGLVLSSNLNLRTCPRFLRLRQAVASGEMGELFHMEADYYWGRVQKLTQGWRGDMEFYSIIHGAAVHMIDLILWVTGSRPVSVQGLGNAVATRGSKLRFNDFAVLLLQFENGMSAKVTGNGGCVHPHFHRVAAFGTSKTFVHEHAGARLYDSRNPDEAPETVTEAYPGVPHKADLIHGFVDAVLDPAKSAPVDAEDVFATMSVCLTAEQAVAQGRPVEIEYI